MADDQNSSWDHDEVIPFPVLELVRLPELQCRAGIRAETVREYADALQRGVNFPPLLAVREGDAVLLVDGWHRAAAAELVRQERLTTRIITGDRRTALLLAVGANGAHGLPRTQVDKRRAVRALLQDPEWCKESSRELGERADVSHAFVSKVRRAYNVKRAERLTEERIEEVDGDLPAAWAALVTHPALERDIRKIRALSTLEELDRAALGHQDAMILRLHELRAAADLVDPGDQDLDVADDPKEIREHLEGSALDPERLASLWSVWSSWRAMVDAKQSYQLPHRSRFAGRPALLALLEKRARELGGDNVDHLELGEDPAERLEVVQGLTPDQWMAIHRAFLIGSHPSRYRVGAAEQPAFCRRGVDLGLALPCPDPLCEGCYTAAPDDAPFDFSDWRCLICRQDAQALPDQLQRQVARGLQLIGAGIAPPGNVSRQWDSEADADGTRLQLLTTDHPHGGTVVSWPATGRCFLVVDGRIHAPAKVKLSAGERAAVVAAGSGSALPGQRYLFQDGEVGS